MIDVRVYLSEINRFLYSKVFRHTSDLAVLGKHAIFPDVDEIKTILHILVKANLIFVQILLDREIKFWNFH